MSKNSANFKLRAKGAYDRHLIGLSFSPKSKFSFISWKFNSIVHEGKNKLKNSQKNGRQENLKSLIYSPLEIQHLFIKLGDSNPNFILENFYIISKRSERDIRLLHATLVFKSSNPSNSILYSLFIHILQTLYLQLQFPTIYNAHSYAQLL